MAKSTLSFEKVIDNQAFILNRDEAYIGVLIDDLISKGDRKNLIRLPTGLISNIIKTG